MNTDIQMAVVVGFYVVLAVVLLAMIACATWVFTKFQPGKDLQLFVQWMTYEHLFAKIGTLIAVAWILAIYTLVLQKGMSPSDTAWHFLGAMAVFTLFFVADLLAARKNVYSS